MNSYSKGVVDTVLLKVAARCNLACTYCYFFYAEDRSWLKQPKFISDTTVDALVENLVELQRYKIDTKSQR